jgi:hypothetical protein
MDTPNLDGLLFSIIFMLFATLYCLVKHFEISYFLLIEVGNILEPSMLK